MNLGPIEVALRVADECERLGITYLIGGSLASSVAGEPRSTLDVDVVLEISEAQVSQLAKALEGEFYIDREALSRAIREKATTNLVHLGTAIKVDLFIAGSSPIDSQQLRRRQRIQVATDPDRYLFVHTPEDILLQKLRWFRMGDESSDRQWRDILGICLVQGEALDVEYLKATADILGVSHLLSRVLGTPRP
jgi:hypothetical protein